jgi:glycosyltransferase involved in cell wall biosynthesis
MKIFFDHQIFSQQEYGGISRYFSELISHININPDHEAYLSVLLSNNIHLQEAHINVKPFFPFHSFYKKNEIMYKVNDFYSKYTTKTKYYDLFHATNYNPYFVPYIGEKPFVVTFYDMIHEKFSGKYKELSDVSQIIIQKKIIAEKASAVITISESTKNDLIELYKINPEKIHVIHLGSSFEVNHSIAYDNDKINRRYILFVGKRDAYKNFGKLLKSIVNLLKINDLLLVCAGGGDFTSEEKDLIDFYNIKNNIVYKPITDKTLPQLYKMARVFVFPSLYEGFGIPILEAFSCGCPCVVSNTSSLPEVAGEAALYFNPDDEQSILEAVTKVTNNSLLREELISKGYERLKMFSWRQTSELTLRVYASIL